MAWEGETSVLDVSSAPTIPGAYVPEGPPREAFRTGATRGVEEMSQGPLVSRWHVSGLAVPSLVPASGRRRKGLSWTLYLIGRPRKKQLSPGHKLGV